MKNLVDDDYGDDSMQCVYHPYKNNSPTGGICALCLQDKLGKLVSSPFLVNSTMVSSSLTSHHSSSVLPINTNTHPYHHFKKSKIPFLPTHQNKNQNASSSSSSSDHSNAAIFNRSKSSVMHRQDSKNGIESGNTGDLSTPHKRGFWSFSHFSKRHKIKQLACIAEIKKEESFAAERNERALGHKVSRSRSVGGGNWSFSGDFLGRMSSRFGECALRRVESQRDGKPRLGLGFSDSDQGF
ncbi:hypothetical protein POM88_023365 [Heracleum sosnowskyi]|uniref:Uncharacterized protein n=1 Tax=Heracleum sosnowskyi TaxID=360622 RepID=A0AAD8IKK5_9APIA|nr:hypothetical protein POM88_023365 [Heracleum sosnowskyi]